VHIGVDSLQSREQIGQMRQCKVGRTRLLRIHEVAFRAPMARNIDGANDEDRTPAAAEISAVSLRERCETADTAVTIP
jgi:hypothetical protein